MKSFASQGYLLRRARVEVRLIYTGFLLLVMIGMMTMAAFQLRAIGPTPSRIEAYYRGGDVGGEMRFEKSFRELVEVTHFHSFMMGIVYLVLAHLFIATPMAPKRKRALIIIAFGGLSGDILAPWLIRYVSGALAPLLIVAWLAEWVGFLAFTLVPIREMWFAHGRTELPLE